MLAVFRRFIRSRFGAVFAILFLAVIAGAFILGDLSNGQFGSTLRGSGGTAAKAGGHSLSQSEVQDRIQRVYENARRSNPALTIGEFFAQGGATQVFDQLVASLTLRAFAIFSTPGLRDTNSRRIRPNKLFFSRSWRVGHLGDFA